MLRRIIVVLALLCGFVQPVAAANRDLQNQLSNLYSKKTVFLRHSFISSAQEYDSDGNPKTDVEEGPWLFYGSLTVKKIALHEDRLRLEGNRVIQMVDEGKKHLVPLREATPITVTIRLRSPLTSLDQALAVLGRVFAVTEEDALNSMPPELRAYFATQPATRDAKDGQPNAQDGAAAAGEKILKMGPGVTAPKPVFTPAPEFSGKARQHGFEGVVGLNAVVDGQGRVSSVTVVHPLGMGLDEEAVRTVKTWRFTPGKKDGQPVAVLVYIEVDFHLAH